MTLDEAVAKARKLIDEAGAVAQRMTHPTPDPDPDPQVDLETVPPATDEPQ
jgi:hypothetical protein